MEQTRTYTHLSPEERAAIMLELHHAREDNRPCSIRALARALNRNPSTISRELRRLGDAPYDATLAAIHYRQQRQNCRRQPVLVPGPRLYRYVFDRLVYRHWSPQQITARLRRMPASKRPGLVSHETIYATIYAQPRGELKKALIKALRRSKPRRGNRRTTAATTRSFVPEELRIQHRPEEIEGRLIPGHWEGDLIKGAYNRSAVGVLVERHSRYLILCKMDDGTAEAALEGFTRQMKKMPAFMRKSLTYDRGSEMACFRQLSERLNIDIWFCDPHAPWQRGSNENTNGLLRQFLPKGMDLSTISQTRLNDIARLMNGRPRLALDAQTPDEVMTKILDDYARPLVALDS